MLTSLVPLSCLFLSCAGIKRPEKWTTAPLRFLYNLYTGIALLFLSSLCVSESVNLLKNTGNLSNLCEYSFVFMTVANVYCKLISMLMNREKITSLISRLLHAPYMPENEDELAIQKKYNQIVNKQSSRFAMIILTTLTGLIMKSLVTFKKRTLLTPGWYPYDYTASTPIFFVSLLFQIINGYFVVSINIGTDSLITGLMTHVTIQLEMFKSRLKRIPALRMRSLDEKVVVTPSILARLKMHERRMISDCVKHHNHIFEYASRLNDHFVVVLFFQMLVSMIIFCFTVYHLSVTSVLTVEFFTAYIYLMSVLIETLYYNWNANEVTLKSLEIVGAVFEIEWTELDAAEQKDLVTIMLRATRPIKFTSSFLVTLSAQAFVNIVKTSYSVFNLMKNT